MGGNLNSKGITIIELLIALALISIVMSGLMTAYWSGNSAFKKQIAGSDAQYMARTAMQWVVADIREASEIIIENNQLLITTIENETVWYKLDDNNQLLRNRVPVAENITNISYNTTSRLMEIIIVAVVNGEVYTLAGSSSPRVQK